MVAQVCGYQPYEFIHTFGDAHIYLDHVDQINEQLSREPKPLPKLWLNPEIKDFHKFDSSKELKDIKLLDYENLGVIKMPVTE